MADELSVTIDTAEFEKALAETEQDLRDADYQELTSNARRYVYLAAKDLPSRTGNLRSAMTPIWRQLGISGRPFTRLDEGQKIADYIDKRGRARSAKLMSRGTFEDCRRNADNPYFSFALFAAEWRGRNKRDNSAEAVEKALRAGLLGASDLAKIGNMVYGGANYEVVWRYLVNLLSGTPGGRTFLINEAGGYWKAYSTYIKGNRKKIKTNTEFKWKNYHAKVMEKHSGK